MLSSLKIWVTMNCQFPQFKSFYSDHGIPNSGCEFLCWIPFHEMNILYWNEFDLWHCIFKKKNIALTHNIIVYLIRANNMPLYWGSHNGSTKQPLLYICVWPNTKQNWSWEYTRSCIFHKSEIEKMSFNKPTPVIIIITFSISFKEHKTNTKINNKHPVWMILLFK